MAFLFDFSTEFEVTIHRLHLPRLDAAFNGYRLAQISDFHIGQWDNTRYLQAAIELVNQQKPDLIALTGDFVSYDARDCAKLLAQALPNLNAPDGVLAVLGNHDYPHRLCRLREVLQNAGVRELRNSAHTLRRATAALHFVGVDTSGCYHDDLPAAMRGLPAEGAAILLAHEPDFADFSSATGRFDLQLSGHSHGGQLRFPAIGALYYPRRARKYPLGLYQVNEMKLYTNRGVGQAHIPLRLNCRPEVSVFDLQGA